MARFLNILIDRGVMRLVGGGPLGFVASAAVKWLRESLDEDGSVQIVTTEELRPGEKYTVIARPAPTKAERKLQAKLDKKRNHLQRLNNPTKSEVRIARALADNQKAQVKATAKYQKHPGGRKGRRRARKLESLQGAEQKLWSRFDRADKSAGKRRLLGEAIGIAAAALAAEQAAALEAAAQKNRPPRSTVFRVDDPK